MNQAAPLHFLIVEARYYEALNDALLEGAQAALRAGGASFDHVRVNGALETPAAVSMAERGKVRYDGYVVIGAVIRGETYHFEIVSEVSAFGLSNLATSEGLAIGNGILTVENEAQAWARANQDHQSGKNKGGDAANAALTMAHLKQKFAGQ